MRPRKSKSRAKKILAFCLHFISANFRILQLSRIFSSLLWSDGSDSRINHDEKKFLPQKTFSSAYVTSISRFFDEKNIQNKYSGWFSRKNRKCFVSLAKHCRPPFNMTGFFSIIKNCKKKSSNGIDYTDLHYLARM